MTTILTLCVLWSGNLSCTVSEYADKTACEVARGRLVAALSSATVEVRGVCAQKVNGR